MNIFQRIKGMFVMIRNKYAVWINNIHDRIEARKESEKKKLKELKQQLKEMFRHDS